MDVNALVVSRIFSAVTVASDKGRTVHMQNRRSYGLSLCYSGQITYTMNGKTYVSDPTAAVFLPKGQNYRLYGDKKGLFPVIDFDCADGGWGDIVVVPLEYAAPLLADYEKMRELLLFENNRLEVYQLFYGILHRIARGCMPQGNPLSAAMNYLEAHLTDPALSNRTLAEQANISEVYFRRLFVRRYHTTPKQYILDARIKKAQQLLIGSPFSVTAIAENCGFSGLYTFSRAFKDKTGLSPTEYARRYRLFSI